MTTRSATGALCAALILSLSATAVAAQKTTVVYDDFDAPGYGVPEYESRWNNMFGPGELALGGTRDFAGGRLNVAAVPFHAGVDLDVFDHLKYIAISNDRFKVPDRGSVTFASDITATTPGTEPGGLTINGVYGPAFSWADPFGAPPAGLEPYSARVLEGQQAGVVMNVVDFCTGQLFDWFVSGHTAFTLTERLPTSVTGNVFNPDCPGATYVGRDTMYTQIIDEVPIEPGAPHHAEITYSRTKTGASAEFTLDGKRVSKINDIGIPLDKQPGVKYTGTYPSLGPGEKLHDQISSFAIGHGLFSLIDAFPYQHPESPELSVSIPLGDSTAASKGTGRLFGQGAIGGWDSFTVTTEAK